MSEEVKLSKKEQYAAQKRDKQAAIKEKRREIASKIGGGAEPDVNPLNYRLSIMIALNWYNVNADYKQYRSWLNEYLINTERKKLITVLNKVSDHEIRSIGMLCRLNLRDQYLEDSDVAFIESTITRLIESVNIPAPKVEDTITIIPEVDKKPKIVIDKSREEAIRLSEGFEEAIDNFVIKKKSDFNASDYLKANEVPAAVSKKIAELYKPMLSELMEAQDGEDKELTEGYSNFTKAQLKKFVAFVESLINACNQQIVSVKVKKTRAKKPVSPEKLIAKLKFMKEFDELNLKSIKPTSIVESNEIWLYNTKNKRLFVYKAAKDSKLSVKGTAITGYDIKESVSVCLRKPEEFFKNTQLAKRALGNAFKSIKTKPALANGRTCETMVILGAF